MQLIDFKDKRIAIIGRVDKTSNNACRFSFPGISFKIRIKGSDLFARLQDFGNEGMNNHFAVVVDGNVHSVIKLSNEVKDYALYNNQDENWHTIELFKRTESLVGECAFWGFLVEADAEIETVKESKIVIEFIGDSITCGYGIEAKHASDDFEDHTENAGLSFASVTAQLLHADYTMVAYSGKGLYRNWAGDANEGTTLSEMYFRTLADKPDSPWDFSTQIPSIVIINLGSNDFSPPHFADENMFKAAYRSLLNTIRKNYGTSCYIFCVTGPVLIKDHGDNHDSYVKSIVEEYNTLGDSRMFSYFLSRQTSKSGYGAQWHPSITQSKKNGTELANFIAEIIHFK